jgi:CRISPR/Cas system CSM-associated protein Csm4 (group 5 of RAMP superfamily)
MVIQEWCLRESETSNFTSLRRSTRERKPVCYANEVYQKNAKQKTEKLKKFMANCNDINDIHKKIKKIQYGDPRMVSTRKRRAEKQRTNPPTESDSGVHSVSYARFDEKNI